MSYHLQKEIESLKDATLRLCANVEKMLSLATVSVIERNEDMAKKVISSDIEIDQMEVDIEENCLKILALYQPVAIDLRIIVAILKINNDLERIGDLAVNIAERSVFLATKKPYPDKFDFAAMAEIVSDMLKKSVDALVNMDVELAAAVCFRDDAVDQKNRDMYKLVESMIKDGFEDVTGLIHLLSVSRHLERVADHATNIAEDVMYMIKGDIVRHTVEDYVSQQAE